MEDKELQEARNCVKEANLFEENMTVDEIKQTYRMIQMSKESKEKDEQKRSSDPFTFETESDNSKSVEQDINSLVEELCSPSTLSLGKKEVSEASEESNKKSNKLNGNLNMVDATKIKFGYLDMPPMSKIDYKLVEHQSKFVLIQHTDEFCNADFATQVKMLASHWSKPSKAEAGRAKLTLNATKRRPSEYRSFLFASTSEGNYDTEETYISRSGRHTKRKCYATSDDDSNDVNTTPKKSKASDQEWQCNISNNNNNNVNIESKVKSPTKKSKSTPAKDIEQESKNGNDGKNLDYIPTLTPLEMEEEPMDQQQPDVLENLVHSDSQKPTIRLRSKSKKLSNEQIMKRSNLFGENIVKNRAEEMLNKSIEERAKKKREERLMEKFEKSIDSTIEDDESEPVSPIDEVKVIYPRRVIPPVPRKNIGSRANKIAAAIAASNQASTSQDPEVSSSSRTATRSRLASTSQEDKIEAAASVSNVDTSSFAECPICQKSFHIEAIQEHASTCGDDDTSNPTTKRLKRISCEVCGGHFPFGDRYNIHVTDCLRVRQEQDSIISKYKKLNN